MTRYKIEMHWNTIVEAKDETEARIKAEEILNKIDVKRVFGVIEVKQ